MELEKKLSEESGADRQTDRQVFHIVPPYVHPDLDSFVVVEL